MNTLPALLFSLIFIINSTAFAQTKNLIIKLKSNTPQEIVNNFKTNNPKSGNNSLSKLSKDFDVKNSKELFKNTNRAYINNDSYKEIGFDKIFVIDVNEKNIEQFVSRGSKNEFIEYLQLNNSLRLEGISEGAMIPNDPYYNSQYYLEMIGMQNVWDITLGDSNIVLGVIDTGLDFLHPDLQTSFKINYSEYGNGKESNGIDDDDNGFIDDWRGWDFTDEPFTGDPARGDYLDPDNDPTDGNFLSHGTAVTGIINATFNNNLGISSIAPKCKVLIMRAFDDQGFGEEDDVANAILYAISRGVRILNFSFGDYIFSNLLRDVVKFAHTKNVLIACSAGNDNSDRLHYPSAYDEVISVAASDPTDFKASFSSFGETVDIYAPAFQNLTTVRRGKGNSLFNNDYDKFNGTSFAAPIVAGVAALLLSKNPNLTNEELRGILVSSTTLMAGQTAWDHIRSSGRINAISAMENFNNPSISRINYPHQDFSFDHDVIPINISAASPLYLSHSLYYGIGQNPSSWISILTNQTSQVLNDTVTRWNTSALADTSYTLRLAINSNSGRTIEHRMIIFKDKNPPIITDAVFGNIIDKNNFSELILFATNKRTLGKIYYKRRNVSEPFQFILADVGTPNIGFVADVHYGLLKGNDLLSNTEYEFYIEAISLNGKSTSLNDTSFYFYSQSPINSYGYVQKNYSLTYSQACNTILDINNNGFNDVFMNDINDNLKLNAFEFSNGNFLKISNDNWGDNKIIRDVGDIDGDGKIEILLSKIYNGFVYEAPSINELPTNLVWADSANDNFWSSKIADADNDGNKEILGFGKSGLRILESSNNTFTEIAKLDYFGRDSQAIIQNVIVDDFDSDSKKEIFFVNSFIGRNSTQSRIAFSLFENTLNNEFERVFIDSTDRTFGDNFNLISGNFLGDGKKQFGIGTVSNNNDLVQYYSLLVYKATANNIYSILDVIDINNYKSYSTTSTKASDIDNDGIDEILINVGTHFYVLKYNNVQGKFIPIYYMKDINSIDPLVFDFDGNQVKEIGLNTINDTLLFFEKNISFTGPSTPLNFRGYSLDSNVIKLSFETVIGADYYRIYRGDTTQNFILYDSTNTTEYFDLNILNNKNYYYKVSSIDNQNSARESQLSNFINVYSHNKSKLTSAIYDGNGFMTIKFSERLSSTIPNLNSFYIQNIGHPKNVAIKNNFEYFLTIGKPLLNGDYSVQSFGLYDAYNSPIDSNAVSFNVYQIDSAKFYISKLNLVEKFKLKVEFNLDVDSASATNTVNYKFEPFDINIISVQIDNANKNVVYVSLENKGSIGATGKNYLLKAYNIYASNGIKIVDGAGSSFGLIFNRENLDEMYVYPNPYSISAKQNYITFANITRETSVDIYDLGGRFLINIKESNGNGGVEWNLKDKEGNDIMTGIYLYRATGKNSSGIEVTEKIGKFAIVK